MTKRWLILVAFAPACLSARAPTGPSRATSDTPRASAYAEIRVLDAETGRGVPLAELVTVNHLRFVTDNAGRVAFNEPGLSLSAMLSRRDVVPRTKCMILARLTPVALSSSDAVRFLTKGPHQWSHSGIRGCTFPRSFSHRSSRRCAVQAIPLSSADKKRRVPVNIRLHIGPFQKTL
jgi:hypothetical protein